MDQWYKKDLAFIHDVGFSAYALKSASGILQMLERSQIRDGLVVDLGCGSGLWAEKLVQAGYQVLGIDISEAMIDIARSRVPEAEFRVVPDAGHSAFEPGNTHELVSATDKFR